MSNPSTKVIGSNRPTRHHASSPSPTQEDPQDPLDDDEAEPSEPSGSLFLEERTRSEDSTPSPEPMEAPAGMIIDIDPPSDEDEPGRDTLVSNMQPHLLLPIPPWQQQFQTQDVESEDQQMFIYDYGQGYPPSPTSTNSSVYTPSLTEGDSGMSCSICSDMPFDRSPDLSPQPSPSPELSSTGTHPSLPIEIDSSEDGHSMTSRCSSRSLSPFSWTESHSRLSPSIPLSRDGLYKTSRPNSPSPSLCRTGPHRRHSPDPLWPQDDLCKMPRSHSMSSSSSSLLAMALHNAIAETQLPLPPMESLGQWLNWAEPRSPSFSTRASVGSSTDLHARSMAPSPAPLEMDFEYEIVNPPHLELIDDQQENQRFKEPLSPSFRAPTWSTENREGSFFSSRAATSTLHGPPHRYCTAVMDVEPRHSLSYILHNCGEDFDRHVDEVSHEGQEEEEDEDESENEK
ncbi:hypothetical protein EMPS_02734 [Entomortierella parvispora]|uniref:Uncharacterized protein n=1 Tax=Entomortierella parvispora TaxID=205924 RepID=A0A9P3H5I6_9FUNG|nr:hypothetical protein EMPS_02734 [Entomortierella parvispora]